MVRFFMSEVFKVCVARASMKLARLGRAWMSSLRRRPRRANAPQNGNTTRRHVITVAGQHGLKENLGALLWALAQERSFTTIIRSSIGKYAHCAKTSKPKRNATSILIVSGRRRHARNNVKMITDTRRRAKGWQAQIGVKL